MTDIHASLHSYYINNDIAKSFDFSYSCPPGVSMTLAMDAFTMKATYN